MTRRRSRAFLAIALLYTGLFSSVQARADLMYLVQVDTSSIMGESGYFDMQFNPASVGALAATATITNFATTGSLLSDPNNGTDGDVSGSLANTLTINNTDQLNDLFQAISFGKSMSFNLDISGPATLMADPNGLGSAFGLSLYDANFNPLLTTDPLGTVVTIQLNSNATTTVETFPTSPGSGPAATVTSQGGSVPEPSSIVIGGIALAGVGWQFVLRTFARARATSRVGPKLQDSVKLSLQVIDSTKNLSV